MGGYALAHMDAMLAFLAISIVIIVTPAGRATAGGGAAGRRAIDAVTAWSWSRSG